MPRRRTHEKGARTKMVCIRMTDDDYVRKASEAKALGLTVSGLCERLVLTGKVEMSAVPTYRVMDPALFAELRRIGNNVNQLAHALNGNLPPDRGYLWNTAQQLLTMLLSEELLNQKTSSLMTRAIANDSPAPQARDVFQRSVWVHPARRTDDFP